MRLVPNEEKLELPEYFHVGIILLYLIKILNQAQRSSDAIHCSDITQKANKCPPKSPEDAPTMSLKSLS